jgi:hypothetical protein
MGIYSSHEEAARYDAVFDAGEFSGPAHASAADREVKALAKANGFTLDDVWREINDISAADDGPYGRIE